MVWPCFLQKMIVESGRKVTMQDKFIICINDEQLLLGG